MPATARTSADTALVGVGDVALCLVVGEADAPGEYEGELVFCADGDGDGGRCPVR